MTTNVRSYFRLQIAVVTVSTLFTMFQSLVAQESVRIRGVIDQCYGVRVTDRYLPIDTISIDRRLPDSVVTAYLLCMQIATPPDSTSKDSIIAPLPVGTSVAIRINVQIDSLLVLDDATSDAIDTSCIYQLVVPIRADTIVVDSTLTTRPWNGSSGGVIILEAARELVLHDTISARGLGYRGGSRSVNGGECNSVVFCAPITSERTGAKGESFHRTDPFCATGYPAWATGGGGGGAHNCGGAGGGNAGAGGRGGDQFTGCGAVGFFGLPGASTTGETLEQFLFGGGGGGGHQNNNAGTDGAAGGGIIILRAPSLRGDSAVCNASGENVLRRAGNDGGGGGGAGGTIVLEICRLNAPMSLIAAGANGGNCDDAHGPGGGGGGGRILVHPSIVQQQLGMCVIDVSGGSAGMMHSGRGSASAQSGRPGIVDVLCNAVPLHEVSIDSVVTAGDTSYIEFVSRQTSMDCPVFVTHTVLIDGGAVIPLVDGAHEDLLVLDEREGWNRRRIALQCRSTESTRLPIQAVVSRETSARIRVSSIVTGSSEACDGSTTVNRIETTTCGSTYRPITLGRPFRAFFTGLIGMGIGYRIEGHRSSDVEIAMFNLQGQLAKTFTVPSLRYVEPGVFVQEGHLDLSSLSYGMYYVLASSALGIAGSPILWRQ